MVSEISLNAIKTALQNEDKSIEIYKSAANNTKNPIVKKEMEFLADWEKQHAEKIRKLSTDLMLAKEPIDLKAECSQDAACIVKEFFNKNIDDFKNNLKGEPADLKVYETGMQIEKEGHDFYKKAAEESDDEEVKQLFTWLASEETVHYKFLEDQHSYLSDPLSWNLDEEKWILEG